MAMKKVKGSHQRRSFKRKVEIPVNVERVLIKAATDEAFRAWLLEDRQAALAEGHFQLSDPERAMLANMDRSMLEAMAARFAPGSRRVGRFARKVASAVAGTMLVTTAACGDGKTDSDVYNPDTVGGIWPDMPEVTDEPDMIDEDVADIPGWDGPVDGIGPDVPPDLVDEDVGGEDVEEEDVEESDG
jgi:hypothetical protein